ncbi:hypothetical protein Nepgr_029408 [Nepenthes gracilis]|uniref:Uncharacterized protein n=1 Tax=Nepenthes gracilis TaxID=150966 RepID=A0AAD3TDI9_NEPGR|nr:hypothetical protein Nepgr_029408 [Nepenthes gracilis]
MKYSNFYSVFVKLLILQSLAVVVRCDYDFFYFVQQWPGSYCDTSQGCCYPTTGKPASDFGIHGLWPNNDDGSYPSNCDPNNPFDPSQIQDLLSSLQAEWPSLSCPSSDGTSFWTHEWDKHGTCSESVLDEHDYFAAALALKSQANLLQALENAGINPNGSFYALSDIDNAIEQATGNKNYGYVSCNTDDYGNGQLYQVYICVDHSGQNFINCPTNGVTDQNCPSSVEFPSF